MLKKLFLINFFNFFVFERDIFVKFDIMQQKVNILFSYQYFLNRIRNPTLKLVYN